MGNDTQIRIKTRLLVEDLVARGYWPRAKELLQNNNALYERLLLSPYLSENDPVLFESMTFIQIEFGLGQDVINEMMANATVNTQDVIASLESQVEALTAEKAVLQQQVTALTNEVAGLRITIEQEVTFLQMLVTELRSIAASYPRVATDLNAVIASINQRIEELGGEPVSTEGGAGDISEPVE